jgi:hypothetical protein
MENANKEKRNPSRTSKYDKIKNVSVTMDSYTYVVYSSDIHFFYFQSYTIKRVLVFQVPVVNVWIRGKT